MKWNANWHPTVDSPSLMQTDVNDEDAVGAMVAGILKTAGGGRVIIEAPNRTRVVIVPAGQVVPLEDFVAGRVPRRGVPRA